MLSIERVGITTVQDVGRRGLAYLGVPTSGAADRASYLLANRLAGNVPGAAMFETSGGLSFTALDDVDVVVTGAECDAAIGSRPAAHCAPMLLRAGETFSVTRVCEGVRAYVAVSGGIVGTPILGSLSHDTLSGIVPVALHTVHHCASGSRCRHQAASTRQYDPIGCSRFVCRPGRIANSSVLLRSTASFAARSVCWNRATASGCECVERATQSHMARASRSRATSSPYRQYRSCVVRCNSHRVANSS